MSVPKSFDDHYPNFDADMTRMLDSRSQSVVPLVRVPVLDYQVTDATFAGYHKNAIGSSFQVFTDEDYPNAWYWWPREPKNLPAAKSHGPFPTAEGAYLDAIGE